MSTEVKVPVLPESVSDATIASWHKKVGDAVSRDENLVDLETDKVVLEVPSPVDGVIKEIKFAEGDTVTSSQIIALIEAGAAPAKAESKAEAPAAAKADAPKAAKAEAPKAASGVEDLSPAGRRVAVQEGIDPKDVEGTGRGGRVTKEDLVKHAAKAGAAPAGGARPEQRVAMTRIRQRIAERLMHSKESIAMLTSSNEVNLREVMKMRKAMGEAFEKAHGVKLGFMSFFVKACVAALQDIPAVNAEIDGTDIIYKNYYDIGVAVGTDRGLVVPVVRDCDQKSLAGIEKGIMDLGKRARDGQLGLEDMQGATFTISNGGVYGSLMSSPILNAPQSGILGMHKIQDRPVAVNGQVVIRPMMYLALSYDHRIVDGKEAVTFLVRVKESLEKPERLLLDI